MMKNGKLGLYALICTGLLVLCELIWIRYSSTPDTVFGNRFIVTGIVLLALTELAISVPYVIVIDAIIRKINGHTFLYTIVFALSSVYVYVVMMYVIPLNWGIGGIVIHFIVISTIGVVMAYKDGQCRDR